MFRRKKRLRKYHLSALLLSSFFLEKQNVILTASQSQSSSEQINDIDLNNDSTNNLLVDNSLNDNDNKIVLPQANDNDNDISSNNDKNSVRLASSSDEEDSNDEDAAKSSDRTEDASAATKKKKKKKLLPLPPPIPDFLGFFYWHANPSFQTSKLLLNKWKSKGMNLLDDKPYRPPFAIDTMSYLKRRPDLVDYRPIMRAFFQPKVEVQVTVRYGEFFRPADEIELEEFNINDGTTKSQNSAPFVIKRFKTSKGPAQATSVRAGMVILSVDPVPNFLFPQETRCQINQG